MNCARNIITANFSGGTSTTTAPLWQWDYGQVLYVTGIEDLPAAFEVHFSTNRAGGVSTVAVGADGQVTIPNVLLTIGKNLNAWIYFSDSEGEGETEYSILIPVKARPMPETYDAEATGVFDDVVRQVSEYAETAQTAANNAGASATAAAQSEANAKASEDAAAASATAAQAAKESAALASRAASTAAQDAKRSADAAAEDAGEAAISAHAALTYRDEAQAAATEAKNAKADAVTAADRAESAATAAGNAATGAGQAATAAGQYATSAGQSAERAETAAQTATTKAGEASASASAAAASETAAQTARQGAEAAETSAGQSASTATAKAAEAAQSASNAAASETAAEAAATRAEQAAASLTVDDALSDTSTNPVQNKVITGELTDVKNAFNENLYSKIPAGNYVVGENVSSSTGAIGTNSSYTRTYYIDITGAESITLAWTGTPGSAPNALCFYDSAKAFISGIVTPLKVNEQSKTYAVPDGAVYMILSGYHADMAIISITVDNITSPIRKLWSAVNTKADVVTEFDEDYIGEKTLLQNVVGVTKFPGNLVDVTECVNNHFIGYTTGLVGDSPNYFCTGYIPVTAGESYKSNAGRNYAWYNASKTYISGAGGTGIQNGVTAPENAAYIRFTINKSTDGMSNPFGLYFADTDDYSLDVSIPGLVAESARPWCYGKTINWIGDSIVDGPDFDEQVCTALNLTKLTTDGSGGDGGINGSTIALSAVGTDGRNALCVRYIAMPDNADMIAVSAGTNDWMYAWCPIGTIDDPDDGTSNNTFYGALKTLCKGLIDKYPQKVIFFTTPIKRGQAFANGAGGEYTADDVPTTPFSKNKYGKTLGDYADIIKEVCGYYSIPVLDMYRESLLNPHISAQQSMFDSVLTHPNATAQKIMARRVCGWITQLGYVIDGLT